MAASETLSPAIVKNTYSLTDFYRRVELLQRFFEHFFFEGAAHEDNRVQAFRSYYREADSDMQHDVQATAAWDGSIFDSFTAQNLYERIQQLKQSAKEVPQLTIYVPVRFTSSQVEPIGIWCRAYVQTDVMLNLHVDPATVGGCAVVYKDVFHNFSLPYFVEKQRPALMKLIHDYGE